MMIETSSELTVELIQHYGDDKTVAQSARVSTANESICPDRIAGLINYLVKHGHTSTLEHCGLTVRLKVPLFVANQIVRHRTGSYNAQSGRYTEFEPLFYVPPLYRPLKNQGSSAHPDLVHDESIDASKVRYIMWTSSLLAYDDYCNLLKMGVASEVARNVLPQSTYTTMWMTMNLNNWFKFLHLRNGEHGAPQWEIVQVAKKIEEIIEQHFPLTYTAWKNS